MNFSISFGKRSLTISTGEPPAPVSRGPGALRATGTRIFGSAVTNRLTADWPIHITSSDAEILVSAIATRCRMRGLERDDDYFRNMLYLLENNIVGDQGIRLRMKARRPDGKLDQEANHAVTTAWNEYLEEENCTVTGTRSGIEVQRLGIRTLARDGPYLVRKHRGFPNAFHYAIEVIEVDRLDHWWNRPAVGTANEIKFGIELNKFKGRVAYWILTRHPGDVFAYSSSPRYRERIDADEIMGIWTIERGEQTVGMPLWPSIAKRLKNLYGYEEAEQVAARAASAKGGWFEVDPKAAGMDEYVGPVDEAGNKLVNTEPGQWEELPAGRKAVANDPNHPTDAFPHFVKAQLRGAAAGGGLPYNAVANDLESVNYSSYKAGMNDARDGFKWLQRLIATKLMRPWFRDWLPYAIMSGRVKGITMLDLDRLRTADCWKPRRWAGLEPMKEVQAAILSVEAGFDSQRNVIEEQFDRDIEEVFDDHEHDLELAEEHGLDFSGEIKKPIIGGGDVDTSSAKEPGRGNGNGHGKADLLEELRAQRYEFATRQQPINVHIDNKPARTKRSIKLVKDEKGFTTGVEIENAETEKV